jgi:hypothetical protein
LQDEVSIIKPNYVAGSRKEEENERALEIKGRARDSEGEVGYVEGGKDR